jgi:hypothetical protein
MKHGGRSFLGTTLAVLCALGSLSRVHATGVPISGFLPLVGMGLSNEFDHDDFFPYYAAYNTAQPTSSIMLGNGSPHFDVALLDTGAGFSAITSQAYNDFNIDGPYSGNPDGFAGENQITVGGATGNMTVDVDEALGLYVAGLQNGTGGASLSMNLNAMTGQTNTSMVTFPAGSDLPNVVGLSFASRYATFIHNDQPQIFQLNGKTVRAPAITFHTLGSGNTFGITRRAFLDPQPTASFGESQTPVYVGFGNGSESWADPIAPTELQASGGTYLTVNAKENNQPLGNYQFLFDTGADVTVVSAFSANQLGYSGTPDFTVAVVGSGGTFFDVPGFFLDELTVFASNYTNQASNNLALQNVPVIILDVTNPNGGGILPGIIGTNVLAGRNAVIDPRPVGGGISPGLYISDPVTTQKNWTSTAASASFATGGNWSGGSAPDLTNRGVANVRNVSGSAQIAVVSSNSTVWELNVSGNGAATMKVQINSGLTFTTYSGVNIESGGEVRLLSSTLDTQYVDIRGGTLSGNGTIITGSGPIPGQVENHNGLVNPREGTSSLIGTLNINGRFVNDELGTILLTVAGSLDTGIDHIVVTGDAALDGILMIALTPGYNGPNVGDTFTFLTATDGVTGAFSQVQGPDGFNWRVNYLATSVQLIVGNPGDFNNDGKVDTRDYVVWRKNSGGSLNYAAWKSHYGAVYSGSGSANNDTARVPEPASILLSGLFACGLAFRRRRPTVFARFAA